MTKFNNRRVIVTGGAGFIGSHLVEFLVQEGAKVSAFVRYNSSGSSGWLEHLPPHIRPEVELIFGDIRDAEFVRRSVSNREVVFHLAALIGIPYSYQAPRSYIETNIQGTLNLLEAAVASGVESFVHTSTSEVYGTAQIVPMDESHPTKPSSPYAASKLGADHLALSYHHSFGLPVSVVRPFNCFGPRQSLRAVIPSIIVQALQGRQEFELGALTPTRDFTHVERTVSGFLLAAANSNVIGKIVNLGSGFEVSVGEVVQEVSQLLGVELKCLEDARRLRPANSEVLRLFAGTRLASDLLGWRVVEDPRMRFREELKRTVEWFRDESNLKRYGSGETFQL